jgi:DNA-binding phage protein
MTEPRTGAERYLAEQLKDPEFGEAYERARDEIDLVDRFIRALDDRRVQLNLSKAEVARRAGMKPEAIRRLFSSEGANPTLRSLVVLAEALDVEIQAMPRMKSADVNRRRSTASGTRFRTA